MDEDVDTRQSAESGSPPVRVEEERDAEQLCEMLETEVPTPEEAGYGHGV